MITGRLFQSDTSPERDVAMLAEPRAARQVEESGWLAADTALYEAKAAGGDRAILHQSSQSS
jgi:hypothetical protein